MSGPRRGRTLGADARSAAVPAPVAVPVRIRLWGGTMAKDAGPDQGASGYFAPVAKATYVQLTTYRRNGEPVATPVNIVVVGDTAFFRTWDVAGKAKRLRHTPTVLIAPCTWRGRPTGPSLRADAQLLDGVAAQHAARMLGDKHPLLHGHLIPWYHRRRGWTTQQYRLTPPAPVSG